MTDVDALLASIDDVLGPDDGAGLPQDWEVRYSEISPVRSRFAVITTFDRATVDRGVWSTAAHRGSCEARSAVHSITPFIRAMEDLAAFIRRAAPTVKRLCTHLGLPYGKPVPPVRRVDAARGRRVATAMRRVERRTARRDRTARGSS